jgi:hypothetical protein
MFMLKVFDSTKIATTDASASSAGQNARASPSFNRYPAMIIAPAAPMAPAWFTVATPAMIEPSTMKISTSGGTSEIEALSNSCRLKPPSTGTAGASFGRISAVTSMYSMYSRPAPDPE